MIKKTLFKINALVLTGIPLIVISSCSTNHMENKNEIELVHLSQINLEIYQKTTASFIKEFEKLNKNIDQELELLFGLNFTNKISLNSDNVALITLTLNPKNNNHLDISITLNEDYIFHETKKNKLIITTEGFTRLISNVHLIQNPVITISESESLEITWEIIQKVFVIEQSTFENLVQAQFNKKENKLTIILIAKPGYIFENNELTLQSNIIEASNIINYIISSKPANDIDVTVKDFRPLSEEVRKATLEKIFNGITDENYLNIIIKKPLEVNYLDIYKIEISSKSGYTINGQTTWYSNEFKIKNILLIESKQSSQINVERSDFFNSEGVAIRPTIEVLNKVFNNFKAEYYSLMNYYISKLEADKWSLELHVIGDHGINGLHYISSSETFIFN